MGLCSKNRAFGVGTLSLPLKQVKTQTDQKGLQKIGTKRWGDAHDFTQTSLLFLLPNTFNVRGGLYLQI